MRGVALLLLSVCSEAAFLDLPAVVRPGAAARAAVALQEGGNYAVGTGSWPADAERKKEKAARAPQLSKPKRARGGGPRGRGDGGGKARGRGGGRGGRGGRGSNVVLENVLRKMRKLDSEATLETVDEVLKGRALTARDYTTLLSALKERGAWPVALRVGGSLQDLVSYDFEAADGRRPPFDGCPPWSARPADRVGFQGGCLKQSLYERLDDLAAAARARAARGCFTFTST